MPEKPLVAVVEGGHPYDAVKFHRMFQSFDDVECIPQGFETWGCNWGENLERYAAIVFYNMNMDWPALGGDGAQWAVERFAERNQGIVFLHHAILALPECRAWSDAVGIAERGFDYHPGQTFEVSVVDDRHAITRGLSGWTMEDETYTMAEPGGSCEVLLRTQHPKSMSALAWTRQHGNARVFCFQSGHDHTTWEQDAFRTVLHRGIRWAAGGG